MQVLLSRRKIEIAMLKTTGYRRLDLYLLQNGGPQSAAKNRLFRSPWA